MVTSQTSSLPPRVGPTDRVVLFDGVCKLCGAWARFLIRFDTKHTFKLASIQSEEGTDILTWYGLPTDDYDTMVVVEGPRLYTKSAAFLNVMRGLPFPWPLVSVFWLVPSFLRDWLYNRLALNRYRLFGQTESCLMPTPDHMQRFLKSDSPRHA